MRHTKFEAILTENCFSYLSVFGVTEGNIVKSKVQSWPETMEEERNVRRMETLEEEPEFSMNEGTLI